MSQPASIDEVKQLLSDLYDDPVLFVRACCGAEPSAWQAEALADIHDHDRVCIRSGHGVGKTAFLSWVILWWLLTRYPVKVACTANTASQLNDVLWPEIAKWARKLPDFLADKLELKSDKIELKGGGDSFAVARTSRKEQPEALQGFHSPNMLFVIDEASGVPDIVFEVGQGAMSTEGAKTVMVGNPTRSSGFFYDAHHSDRWCKKKVSCVDSPQVAQEFIEDMARQYGSESNIYRVRVLGDFPDADDDTAIPAHLVDAAMRRDVVATSSAPVVWGVDVARFGDDRTALCKRRGNVVLEPIRSWRNKDLMQVCGLILTEYETAPIDEKPTEILVDSIGLGAGVVDRLRELSADRDVYFNADVVGVNVAESPALGDRYNKLRDELWFKLKEWLEARDCYLPPDDDLRQELSGVRFDYLSNGKLKIESKAKMKSRGQASPDLADALVLTMASVAATVGSNRMQRWNRPLRQEKLDWIV
mgnify:FL=1